MMTFINHGKWNWTLLVLATDCHVEIYKLFCVTQTMDMATQSVEYYLSHREDHPNYWNYLKY